MTGGCEEDESHIWNVNFVHTMCANRLKGLNNFRRVLLQLLRQLGYELSLRKNSTEATGRVHVVQEFRAD